MHLKSIFVFLICILPMSAYSDIYKCKNADGNIEFKDRPCPLDAETVFTKEEEKGIEYAESMAKIVADLLEGKAKSDPKVKAAMETMAKIQAFKAYAFTRIIPKFIRGCSKVSKPTTTKLQREFDMYLSSMKDYIDVGQSMARTGFSAGKPFNAKRTPSEMESDILAKEKQIVEKFSRVSGSNQRKLHEECSNMVKAINLMRRKV